MDFIGKFQTWACHRLCGLGSDWSPFIHKSWKGSMQTQHMEVFFPEPGPHGSIIIHSSMTHSELGEERGPEPQQKWFFRHWYLMEGAESSTTAISSAPPHMEAIISNGVLGQFPQSKRNHWNSYNCLSSSSVLLLLVRALQRYANQSLVFIIISSSAAVPGSRLDTLKVFFF